MRKVDAVELERDGHQAAAQVAAGEPERERDVEAVADGGARVHVGHLHDLVFEAAAGAAVELLVQVEPLRRDGIDDRSSDLQLAALNGPLAGGVHVAREVTLGGVNVRGVRAPRSQRNGVAADDVRVVAAVSIVVGKVDVSSIVGGGRWSGRFWPGWTRRCTQIPAGRQRSCLPSWHSRRAPAQSRWWP